MYLRLYRVFLCWFLFVFLFLLIGIFVYKVFFIQPDSPRAWELLGRVFEPYNGNVAAVHDKRCHYAQHYRKHTTAHWSPENAGRVVLPATKQGTTPTARPRIKTGSQPPFNQPAALTEQATRVCADGEDHPTHTPTPENNQSATGTPDTPRPPTRAKPQRPCSAQSTHRTAGATTSTHAVLCVHRTAAPHSRTNPQPDTKTDPDKPLASARHARMSEDSTGQVGGAAADASRSTATQPGPHSRRGTRRRQAIYSSRAAFFCLWSMARRPVPHVRSFLPLEVLRILRLIRLEARSSPMRLRRWLGSNFLASSRLS